MEYVGKLMGVDVVTMYGVPENVLALVGKTMVAGIDRDTGRVVVMRRDEVMKAIEDRNPPDA